jgi:hypothetical protein
MSPFSTDGIVAAATGRKRRFPKSRLLAGVALVLALLATGSAKAGFLNIGTVTTFQTSSSLGNPTGVWTLEDKDWTYLSDSGNWTGIEDIQLLTNFNPLIYSHQFLIDNLSGYSSPITLQLGYQAHINGSTGPGWSFYDARMGEDTSGATVEAWQDVYGSLTDFNANTTPGSGTLMTHYSLNGSLPPAGLFPTGLLDIWVRNSIVLSNPGGQISSVSDTFRQVNVPEIDPTSFGSALSLLFGAFGILERRTRRRLAAAVAA